MSDPKRVLLLIETSRAYGRGCLAGVAAYVRAHRNWRLLHFERSLAEGMPSSTLKRWKPDGIVARVETVEMAKAVNRLRIPAVDLRGVHRPRDGTLLDTDHNACARVAVDHFLQHGFQHLAFCGYPGVNFSDLRCDFYVQMVLSHGYVAQVFDPPDREHSAQTAVVEARGEFADPQLLEWLQGLPKPVAVFTCNDIRGRQVLAACGMGGLTVPDVVAVLGVDNDEVICDLSTPPLSSIEPDTRRIGYEGAALLDRLMAGEPPPEESIWIPPKELHVRQSSDVVAVEDQDLSNALRYIRDHACDGIAVDDVARQAAMSRTTLDRRFQRVLGRSPKAEIDRIRVHRAKQLLSDTEYKIATIANMAGYQMAPQFVTAFKRLTGVTPGAFRTDAIRTK